MIRKRKNFWLNKIYEIAGRKCCKCGFNDDRALQIDHINGDGKIERAHGKCNVGITFYRKVYFSITAKENRYQILCANCNWIKRHENEEYRKRINLDNSICKQNQKQTSI